MSLILNVAWSFVLNMSFIIMSLLKVNHLSYQHVSMELIDCGHLYLVYHL